MSDFMSEYQHLKIPLKCITQATNNFAEENFLAKGGFGRVYKGKFIQSNGPPMLAAVKRLTPSSNNGDADFRREIMLISDYKHENIILLLGFCYESGERILVYEYALNKSLDNYLEDPKFTWIQRLKVCLGAARGLEYLHNPRGGHQRVLHRDIKSANILLDQNWNAKIADFGFSKYGPANQQHSILISEPKGTLGYCDPVFLHTTFFKKESDVYSFGVVLSEVLCSRFCIDYRYKDDDMRRSLPAFVKSSSKDKIRDTMVDVNLLQQMQEKSFDTFVTLVIQCLEAEQNQRPPMELVVEKLQTAIDYQEGRDISSINFNFGLSSTIYAETENRDLPAKEEETGRKERRNISSNNLNIASSSTTDAKIENQDLHAKEEQTWRNELTDILDVEIRKWSSGKEGNLRGLISSLTFILGPKSGWERRYAHELVSTSDLRKHYEEAITFLCTAELNREGASIADDVYICEQVLQILKVAYSEECDRLRILGEKYDKDIKRWSSGKQGDLRSLLSTLQDIIPRGSGWKPVSLKKMRNTNNVRYLYEKAESLILPTRLNKRKASIDEKYISEKVLEILKEGLSRLNSQEEEQLRILGVKYDDDINGWKDGKEGDLRALLSTLHDIIPPESGWKPTSVTEIMSFNDVRDLYWIAEGFISSTKLENRKASIDEKYISQKVLEILTEGLSVLESKEKELRRILGEKYDDDINRWKDGKEDDLHALLSTLHNIILPESGWEPVSVNLEMSAYDVRKLYERADYLIRPAMLIKRKASIDEEVISEKVLEILKEGLSRLNAQENEKFRILGALHHDEVKRWEGRNKWCLGPLLESLQDILGPDSGWEPISLNGRWRTQELYDEYNKALFVTDPITLNNRGSSDKHKYICGEVHRMLMEAWECTLAEEK